MLKPTLTPPNCLIDLIECSPIVSLEYDRGLSEDNRATAEDDCHVGGRYTYDFILRVTGRAAGKGTVAPVCLITDTVFEKYVEVGSDLNNYGFWHVTEEGKTLVSNWLKWLKSEEKDIKEYRRLREKFGGSV